MITDDGKIVDPTWGGIENNTVGEAAAYIGIPFTQQAHAQWVANTEYPSVIEGWWRGAEQPEPNATFDDQGRVTARA